MHFTLIRCIFVERHDVKYLRETDRPSVDSCILH